MDTTGFQDVGDGGKEMYVVVVRSKIGSNG